MREILFRGKRKNNGKWVYGNLFIPDNPDTPTQICTGTDVVRIFYDINPETVGQYTGLTDKNGTKIFEGDICEFTNADGEKTPYKVLWDFHRWLVQMGCENIYPDDLDEDFAGWAEIIGNIHDNPELLEDER